MVEAPPFGGVVADRMNPFSEADEAGRDTVPPQPPFAVRISDTPAGVLVCIEGELDVATTPRLLETAGTLIGKERREVELDLSGLTFVDVAGVRGLVRFRDQVLGAGEPVRVRGLHEDHLPAARILGLRECLEARTSGSDESA
jgi:anti-anti-sigma factor